MIADRAPFGAQAPPPRGAMGRWARVAILAAVAALWVMIALAPARALAVRPPGAGASEGVISAQRYPAQSEHPQLNTIRHVVIWLDPWSRERDLLAAVVDR